MGISQKTWDAMLKDGLPFAQIGKSRWVSGQDLIDYYTKKSRQKPASVNER
jgi:hypothetical protein